MPADPSSPSGQPDPDQPVKPETPGNGGESDLWNLDEDLPAKPSAPPVPRTMGRKDGVEPDQSVKKGKSRPHSSALPKENPPVVPQSAGKSADEIGELEEHISEEEPALVVVPDEEQSPAPPQLAAPGEESPPDESGNDRVPEAPAPRRKPNAAPVPSRWTKPSRRDILTLGIFAFLLLLTGIWVLSRFFSQLHFKSDTLQMPDFPLQGHHATVNSAESYWREPVREGPSRDAARREVAMIPVLDLTLDPARSERGALRVIFRSSTGDPVGDSITRSFNAGNFETSGNSSMSFPSTDGFIDKGAFNGYRTRTGQPWTVEVLEGPSVDAPASSFRKLVEIPIMPQSR